MAYFIFCIAQLQGIKKENSGRIAEMGQITDQGFEKKKKTNTENITRTKSKVLEDHN